MHADEEDWDAVLAVSAELDRLDPDEADPDGLAIAGTRADRPAGAGRRGGSRAASPRSSPSRSPNPSCRWCAPRSSRRRPADPADTSGRHHGGDARSRPRPDTGDPVEAGRGDRCTRRTRAGRARLVPDASGQRRWDRYPGRSGPGPDDRPGDVLGRQQGRRLRQLPVAHGSGRHAQRVPVDERLHGRAPEPRREEGGVGLHLRGRGLRDPLLTVGRRARTVTTTSTSTSTTPTHRTGRWSGRARWTAVAGRRHPARTSRTSTAGSPPTRTGPTTSPSRASTRRPGTRAGPR